jgi:D-glycero-alpha-D-manno-heptose 1-phosphate guanylyltransferase
MSDPLVRPFTAVVLAGGFGTRIRHLLGTLPKPLAPVCGEPFLHWVLANLRNQGANRVLLLAHYESAQVVEFARRESDASCRIDCLVEDSPLGTGGAILSAIKEVDLPEIFLLVNGDSLVITDITPAMSYVEGGAVGAIIGVQVDDGARYGTLEFAEDGRLCRFKEKREGVGGMVNSGMYVMRKSVIVRYDTGRRPLSIETEVFSSMLVAGEDIRVVPTTAAFIDIGTKESLPTAEAFVVNHLLKSTQLSLGLSNEL